MAPRSNDRGSRTKGSNGVWPVVEQGRGAARATSGLPHVYDDRHSSPLGRKPGKQRATARHSWLSPGWLSFRCGHRQLERKVERQLHRSERRGDTTAPTVASCVVILLET